MAYKITKQPDGDINFGSWNGESVTLQPSTSDYATGGYPIVDGVSVVDTSSLNANCDLYRVLAVIPNGGQGGYEPVWNQATKKLQIYQNGAINGPAVEVAANTDLSGQTFYLLLMGL